MKAQIITSKTESVINSNINRLNGIVDRTYERKERQLRTLNKLRKMNGKQQVCSFAEHKELKSIGL